ncbi:hypothetical protein GTP23_19415 [Pseudoduganella sp. FT93W]|uniref:Uncharacterized protein n=1 Tax=Duganella fentianensis TaxID=2692177 RepID=A0A845I5Z3_9BURK|nr:hypothetical protein [Duganella fentianensis]MYN47216.1 hypothetical protein [Duganella fentianensis]
MTARPRALPPILLTVLLHCALLLALLQGVQNQRQTRPRGPAIQWLLPAASAPVTPRPHEPAPKPAPLTAAAITLHKASAAAPQASSVTESAPVIAASPGAAPVTQAQDSAHDDPFALDKPAAARTAPASADELLQQARKSVGRIDQQLRAESPQRFPLPPPDSMQARLERGINAAHEAVPPKWYQGARMVELSTPDGERKSRLYKIVTAFGSYCVTISPEGRRSYSNCP